MFLTSDVVIGLVINPSMRAGNYTATSNNTKLVHWPLVGGCYIWYSDEENEPAQAPPCCTKCNGPPINGQCTNHHIAV